MLPFRLRHADKVAASFVALVVVVLLAVLFLIFKAHDIFVKRIPYHTVFDDAGGIAKGTAVKLAGIEVGKVVEVSLTEHNKVRVDFEVLDRFADRITADPQGLDCAKVAQELELNCGFSALAKDDAAAPPGKKSCAELDEQLKQCGSRVKAGLPGGLGAFLPGGGGLNITVGNMNNPPVAPGGLVKSERGRGLNDILQDLQQQGVVRNAKDIVEQVSILLRRINDMKGPIWQSVENVHAVTADVRAGKGVVGQAITPGSPLEKKVMEAIKSLDSSLEHVEEATVTLKKITADADKATPDLYAAIEDLAAFSELAKGAAADLKIFAQDSRAIPPDVRAAVHNLDERIDDLGDILRSLKQSFPLNLVVDERDRPDKGAAGESQEQRGDGGP